MSSTWNDTWESQFGLLFHFINSEIFLHLFPTFESWPGLNKIKSLHCYNVLCDTCVSLCLHCVCQSPQSALENQSHSHVGFSFSNLLSSELSRQLLVVTLLVHLSCWAWKEKTARTKTSCENINKYLPMNGARLQMAIKNPPAAFDVWAVNWHAWHCVDTWRHVSQTRLLPHMPHILQLCGTALQLLLCVVCLSQCVSFQACQSTQGN